VPTKIEKSLTPAELEKLCARIRALAVIHATTQ